MQGKIIIILLATLFFYTPWSASATKMRSKDTPVTTTIKQIEQYYLMDKEHIPYDEVMHLSADILKQRQSYPSNIIAKTYALLADAATSKADMAKAFQFASDGLSLVHNDVALQLNFLRKICEGYYVNGQFHKTLEISNQAIELASSSPEYIKQQLVALGYRAMAYALLAEHELANADLLNVTELIEANDFSEHIDILGILAIAYHHLGDIKTAVNMQNQLIEMKLAKSNFYNLDQNYFNLARGYEALGRYDDAYTAFWDAQKIAEEKSAFILQGYIQLGLGKMLLEQEQYQQAYQRLNQAESLFIGQNQNKPHLSTLIYLADAAKAVNRIKEAEQVLYKAEKLVQNIDITKAQIILYQQLHLLYKRNGDYEKALAFLSRYIDSYQHFYPAKNFETRSLVTEHAPEDTGRALASRLVAEGQLKNVFASKYDFQRKIILILSVLLLILVFVVISLWLNKRSLKLIGQYNESERPADFLHNSNQTKNLYQLNYKKARKYNYPIAIGYIMVDNWKELSFQANKKVRDEVSRSIATLINQSIGEFDCVGMLNEGQYLLLCPHQTNDDIKHKLEKLSAALEVNYFANLGGFAVSIGYAFDTPSVQDIDPYIFLSRLSERISSTFSQ